MNSTYYNGKYSFLTLEPLKVDIPSLFVPFVGTKEELYLKVKTYEFENDEVFNGHFFIKDYDLFLEYFMAFELDKLKNDFIPTNYSYFYKVFHDGVDSKCTVDSSLGILSGYALSFFLNSDRTKVNEYVNLARHRIVINPINDINDLKYRLV